MNPRLYRVRKVLRFSRADTYKCIPSLYVPVGAFRKLRHVVPSFSYALWFFFINVLYTKGTAWTFWQYCLCRERGLKLRRMPAVRNSEFWVFLSFNIQNIVLNYIDCIDCIGKILGLKKKLKAELKARLLIVVCPSYSTLFSGQHFFFSRKSLSCVLFSLLQTLLIAVFTPSYNQSFYSKVSLGFCIPKAGGIWQKCNL